VIFKIVQTAQSLSHLPLFILQKQTNKVLSLGQQNKLLQRFRAAVAAAVRRVAASYKLCANKSLQISRADDIRPYRTLFHYLLLLITLSVSELTPQSRLTPSQLPCRGAKNTKPAKLSAEVGKIDFYKNFMPPTRIGAPNHCAL
jgi:hypothetical protein